jgi:hypothetical protein
VTQDGNSLQLGGTANDASAILIGAGGTYDLVTNAAPNYDVSYIYSGGDATVFNAGLLESTGSYVNYIYSAVDNTGTILAASGNDLGLEGGGSIGGVLTGAGEIDLNAGLFTLASSLADNVAVLGVGGTAVIGGSFDFTNEISLYGGTLELAGHSLTLANAEDYLSDAVVGNGAGGNTVVVTNNLSVGDASIEGNATLIVDGTVTQDGNSLQLGGTTNDASAILIAAGGTYDLEAEVAPNDYTSEIYSGGDATIVNAGLLESTGAYVNYIYAAVDCTGTILAAEGNYLELDGGGTIGGVLTGAGEIDLAESVFTLSPTVAISVAALGFYGTVALGANLSYGGFLDVQDGELQLNGHNLISSGGSYLGSGAILEGAGTLKVAGQNGLSGFNLTAGAVLEDAGTITQTGNLQLGLASSDAATLQIDAGAVYDDQAQGGVDYNIYSDGSGSSIINAGLLEFTGYWSGQQGTQIQANVRNTGTLLDLGNDLLFTGSLLNDGVVTLTGSLGLPSGSGVEGYVTVDGAISADTGKTGTIVIGADTFFEAASSVAGQDIIFTSSGTAGSYLFIGELASFAGTISGFAAGDGIDLFGVLANTFSYANNVLTLEEVTSGVTAVVGHLALVSVTGTIGLVSDENGGTQIILNNTGTSYSNPRNMTAQSDWSGASAAWTTAADWSPRGEPGSLTTAVFDTGGSYTVSYATTDSVYQLELEDAGGTFSMSSGELTVEAGGVSYGSLALAGGTLDIANGFSFEGQETQSGTGTLQVDNGAVDYNYGNFALAGAIVGSNDLGAVVFGEGTNVTLNSGFALKGVWAEFYQNAAATLGASLTFSAPVLFDGGSLDLNSHNLTLSGTSQFGDNYQIEGAGTLVATGTIQLVSLTVGDNANLVDSGTIVQNGAIQLGVTNPDTSSLLINSGAVYDMVDDGNAYSIQDGGTGSLKNSGLLELTGYGNDTETINLPVLNSGTILVTEGVLQLQNGATLNGSLAGAGTLDLYSGTFAVGASLVSSIANFELGGDIPVLKLGGNTLVLGATSEFGPTTAQLDGSGRLKITGTADINSLYVAYNAVIEDAGTILQTGDLYFGYDEYSGVVNNDTSTLLIDAGATYALQGNGFEIYSFGGQSISNNGLLETTGFLNAGAADYIDANFVNTGTVLVNAGDLQFGDGGAFSGTLAGTGEIDFTGGNFTLTSLAASIATLNLDGSNVTLGSNIVDSGDFIGSESVIDLNGFNLTIAGQGSLGQVLEGPGTLKVTGVGSLASPFTYAYLTNGAVLEDAGTLNQDSSYALYLGETTGDTGYLNIDAGRVFNFTSGEIYSEGAGGVSNAGLLTANPGAGNVVSMYAPVTNTGTILATSGVLELGGGGPLGGTIGGGAGIVALVGYFEPASATTPDVTSFASGAQFGLGSDAGGLIGPGTFVSEGTVTVADLGYDGVNGYQALEVDGGLTWNNTGEVNDAGEIWLGYSAADATIVNAAGAVFDLSTDDASLLQVSGGTYDFINGGLLEATGTIGLSGASLTNVIDMAVTNTGTILATGGVLELEGGGPLGGTIGGGSGTVALVGYFGPASGGTDTVSFGSNAQFGLGSEAGGLIGPGTFVSKGTVTVADLGYDGVNGYQALQLDGGLTWNNTGEVNDAGEIWLGDTAANATIVNAAGAVFDLSTDDASFVQVGGGTYDFINAGLLEATGTIGLSGASLTNVIDMSVTNTGTILATSAVLELDGGIAGDTNGTLTGGIWEATASGTVTGTLELYQDPAITIDSANIILSGTGEEIITGLSTPETIEASLVSISAAGILQNLAGHTYSSSNTLTNAGAIILAGGLFKPAKVVNTGSISGYGTIGVAVQDTGTITASGGTLTFSGAVSGTGGLAAVAGATVDLTTGGALTETISGAGTLKLDGTTAYTLGAGATASIANVQIDAGATLSGAGTVDGAVSDAGALSATSGTFVIGGAVTGTGALTAATGATIDLNVGGALTEAISGAGTLKLDGATVYTLAGATISIANVAVDSGATLSGDGSITGSVTDAGTITATGGVLKLAGAVTGTGALTAAAGATVDLTAGSALSEAILGAGTLQLDAATYALSGATLAVAAVAVDAGATLSGSGTVQGTLTDAGTVSASGGTLTLGKVTGTGALTAASGATLDLTAGGALSEAISGTGTLQLDGATAYTLAGATISIANVTVDSGATLSGEGSITKAASRMPARSPPLAACSSLAARLRELVRLRRRRAPRPI